MKWNKKNRNQRNKNRKTKKDQRTQGKLLLDELKETFKPKWEIAIDESRANLLFFKHNMPDMMNKGFSLKKAKELTKDE